MVNLRIVNFRPGNTEKKEKTPSTNGEIGERGSRGETNMSRICTICALSERNEIDYATASGEPMRRIATRIHLSEAAVRCHRKHAAAIIAKAAERREVLLGDNTPPRVEKLYKCGDKILDDALANNDGRLELAATSELKGVLSSMYSMAKDAAIAKAAPEPVQVRVFHRDKLAPRIPVPQPRHSLIA